MTRRSDWTEDRKHSAVGSPRISDTGDRPGEQSYEWRPTSKLTNSTGRKGRGGTLVGCRRDCIADSLPGNRPHWRA